jgi:dynactin complex subunit
MTPKEVLAQAKQDNLKMKREVENTRLERVCWKANEVVEKLRRELANNPHRPSIDVRVNQWSNEPDALFETVAKVLTERGYTVKFRRTKWWESGHISYVLSGWDDEGVSEGPYR